MELFKFPLSQKVFYVHFIYVSDLNLGLGNYYFLGSSWVIHKYLFFFSQVVQH